MSVDTLFGRLRGIQRSGNGWTALCPGHPDRKNSLSVGIGDDQRILLKCFAGCPPEAIVNALGLRMKDLFPDANQGRANQRRGGKNPSVRGVKALHPPGVTLAALADAKKLPERFLRDLGLSELTYDGARAVRIPYLNQAGELLATRFRLSLNSPRQFVWRSGDRVAPYGLWRIQTIRQQRWVLLVEGESDCWTAWYHGLPALGIPGKACWRSPWREHLEGVRVYLWQEPDAEDLSLRVAIDVPELLTLPPPTGIKDLSEAHLQGWDVPSLVEELKARAIPAAQLRLEREDAHLADLREQARSVFESADPLSLVKQALRRLGYGGDLKPPIITYLAATSRLLKMRPGSMPVHLLLVGIPSAGKSYTLKIVLSLLPPEAYHEIDAGSPRILIYDDARLEHRVVVFAEADSLPAGEDNPAASAVRNLLQDHQLRYKVTIRDPETGNYRVREITKAGPTALITTAVRRLGPQLDTRLFSLDVPDDVDQVRQVLATQAAIETQGTEGPDPALIAFQSYLQVLAPWDVAVPFASTLSLAIGQSVVAPRILRDFSRLLSLIKAVTILRHQQRRVDAKSRFVADVQDYAAVYELVKEMYEATVTGATQRVREAVQAVEQLQRTGTVTVTGLALHLGISKMTASRRVKDALGQGWLINTEHRKGYPANLSVGEPVPEPTGLPHPDSLRGCNAATPETDSHMPPPSPEALEEVNL